MRFGLDRMRRMMTALDSPQLALDSIHIVGTNGKSSTARMVAAILERHGLRTGTYLSPHLVSYTERIQVGERDIEPAAFAGAIERASWAAERVNRTLGEGDHVTQFELLTAAAYWELARREVEVAVVEAGLGGRYDATNVIDSSLCVLTNVGLEHTRWLGPTIADIASEKLAVLKPGSALVLGADPAAEVLALAQAEAAKQDAELLLTPAASSPPKSALRPAFEARNLAVARAAATHRLHRAGIPVSTAALEDAACGTVMRGRFEVVAEQPLTLFDGAHNAPAAAALVESLPDLIGTRPTGLVFGVLEDKDAVGMLRSLLPLCRRAWFTAPPSRRALPPAALSSLARQLGFDEAADEPRPERALAAAQAWGRRQDGGEAAIIATGSVYLVGELLSVMDGRLGLDNG